MIRVTPARPHGRIYAHPSVPPGLAQHIPTTEQAAHRLHALVAEHEGAR